jgi:aminopeptidase
VHQHVPLLAAQSNVVEQLGQRTELKANTITRTLVKLGALTDPRIVEYARLIVERSLNVQRGWQVVIRSTPLARPLLDELARQLGQRGAYPILRLNWRLWPVDTLWAAAAPDDLVGELPSIERYTCDAMDARITVAAPENTREGAELPPARRTLVARAEHHFRRRTASGEIPWAACLFPTPALAQDAELSVLEFERVVFEACLQDWEALSKTMRRRASLFDGAEVRLFAPGTDLTLSLAGRHALVDAGERNLPGGEFYYAPVEGTASGVITFGEFPLLKDGVVIRDARLVFRDGRVVEATASAGEEALHATLETDEGSRELGEFGVGCNPRVTRYIGNPLFDEKIDGTIHVALGASVPSSGGTISSAVHWDMVKDLRSGGRLLCNGEPVYENTEWLGDHAGGS